MMVSRATVALTLMFAMAAFPLEPLGGQYRADQAVAASTSGRTAEGRPRPRALTLSPALRVWSDSATRAHSLGRHLLIGLGVGAAMGLAVGTYSQNHSSECTDCMTPTSAIPAFGAVVGAAAGTLVGWLVYLARSSTPRTTEHRADAGDPPCGSSLTCVASDRATGIRLCASEQ
jgi:hypothetical protein